jgi:hypothetical protein
MATAGPIAYRSQLLTAPQLISFRLSREATLRALKSAKVIPVGPNRWVSHIDGPSFHRSGHSLHSPTTFHTTNAHDIAPSDTLQPDSIVGVEPAIDEAEKKRKRLSEDGPSGPHLGYKQRRMTRASRRKYYSSAVE